MISAISEAGFHSGYFQLNPPLMSYPLPSVLALYLSYKASVLTLGAIKAQLPSDWILSVTGLSDVFVNPGRSLS